LAGRPGIGRPRGKKSESVVDKADLSNVHVLLAWSRVKTWWKYPCDVWQRKRIETLHDDLSPAAKGYQITEIVENASLQDRDGSYVVAVHCCVEDSSHEYWFSIVRSADLERHPDEPDEEVALEGGFDNLAEAKRQAESRLVALLAARNASTGQP
jgi:hypothetical protein